MTKYTILTDNTEYFTSSSADECILTLKELQREGNIVSRRLLESYSSGTVYASKTHVYIKLASGDWLCVSPASGDSATVCIYDMASFLAEDLIKKVR